MTVVAVACAFMESAVRVRLLAVRSAPRPAYDRVVLSAVAVGSMTATEMPAALAPSAFAVDVRVDPLTMLAEPVAIDVLPRPPGARPSGAPTKASIVPDAEESADAAQEVCNREQRHGQEELVAILRVDAHPSYAEPFHALSLLCGAPAHRRRSRVLASGRTSMLPPTGFR